MADTLGGDASSVSLSLDDTMNDSSLRAEILMSLSLGVPKCLQTCQINVLASRADATEEPSGCWNPSLGRIRETNMSSRPACIYTETV